MRYRLLVLLTMALPLAACSEKKAPEAYAVEEVPLSQVSADLAAGKTTSVEVTKGYLHRIETMEEPLNAIIMIAPDALEQAAASDKRRAAGQALGPLDGIPILFKDNFDAVGMPTTAGSFALEKNYPAADSEVVKRLRAAGAVILGKANTQQFAGFRTSSLLNGSTVGGSTKNPYDIARTAAGSSNGSGISAAMSFAAATVGTQTGGSIVSPANVNGVVGVKPTIALVSRRGIVPISLTQDTGGPMARNVRDAAMLLNVMAGSDPGDTWSAEADAHKTDYVAALSEDALQGKRVAVIRPSGDNAAVVGETFDKALAVMTAQGAELVDVPADILVDPRPEMRVTLLHDFKEDLTAYLAATPETVSVKSLADLIAFSKADPRENMHKMDLWEDSEATQGGRRNPAYIENMAKALKMTRDDGIDRILKEYNAVAIVTPTGGPAGVLPPDGTPGSGPIPAERGTAPGSLTTATAVAGYPILSVPMGLVNGLPVGLSFAGTAWSEATLLALAYDYEQASHARVPPPRAHATAPAP
ncbi:MAG: amidase family protein [Rhodospirillaceae bacterium]